MSTYYHGSPVIFDKFNLDSLGEGSGCKFGVGVYLTESFETAAHYSEPRYGSADHHYVYTVEVPLNLDLLGVCRLLLQLPGNGEEQPL